MPGLIPDFPITTTEAPKSQLSKSDIAAPMKDMADAMTAAGTAFSDVATDVAQKAGEEAGRKSVRVDDAGNLVVDDTRNPFIVGKASAAYERAAKLTQLAQLEPKLQTDVLDLRLKHPNDPTGFSAAAKEYADGILGGIQDPHIRGAVSDALATTTQHNLRTSLIETNQTNTAEALQTYQARIKGVSEEMASLARQGAGTAPVDSEAHQTFVAKSRDLAALYNELGADPRFRFSPERARLELDEHYANFKVQDVIGKVQRQFSQDHDLAKATTTLQNAFWGPGSESLNLSQAKRDHGVSEGLAHLRAMATTDHQAVADNAVAVQNFINDQMLRRPNEFNEGQFNNFVLRSKEIGDVKSVQRLMGTRDFLPVFSAESRMSPTQRAAALRDLDRGIMPKAPDAESMAALGQQPDTASFFAARGAGRFEGINPEFAGRLRTAVEAYERQNPGETVKLNDLVRTRDEQAELYRRYQAGTGGLAAAPGTSRHEAGEAVDIPRGAFLTFMHQNAREFGLEFLKGRAFYDDPVHLQLSHGPLVPGSTINLAENQAYGRVLESAVKVYRDRVTKDAERETADVLDRIEKGHSFAPGQLENAATLITASGRTDLWEKLQPALDSEKVRALFPPGTTPSTVNDAVQEALAAGPPRDMRQALLQADDRLRKDYEEMHKDPLGYGPRAEWFGSTVPVDPKAPDTWVANFRDRNVKIGAAQAWIPDLGAVPALRPDEAKAIGTMLTTGDPAQAKQLLGSMQAGLSHENWRATMETDPIKSALFTMFNSNDPARLDAAGGALNRLWGTNPTDFQAKYGEHAVERLMAWKWMEGFTAEERASKLQRADDPAVAKARDELGKVVDGEFKSWSAQNTADALGNWYQRNLPFVHLGLPQNRLLGDDVAAGQLNADFKESVKNFRLYYGLDKATAQQMAVERLSAEWWPSDLNGGRLMKWAPEAYYPQLDGSHDWMKRDLDEALGKIYGEKQRAIVRGDLGVFGAVTTGWRLGGIIADNQTEREIKNGQPPTYQVHVIDRNGQDQLAPGRIRFDPRPAFADYQAKQLGMFDASAAALGTDLQGTQSPAVQLRQSTMHAPAIP